MNKTVYSDIEEMKEGIKTENDIILVLADRYSSNFYEDEWNEARLFQITYVAGAVIVTELEDRSIGVSIQWLDDAVDTGDETTLMNFLQYADNHYSSKNLYLDLWNHGGGWKSGDTYPGKQNMNYRNICLDEESNNSLSLKELSSAIKKSRIKHFDIILMDACSMASIEVAAELITLTDTVVFSQDIIPADGMPYNKIVPVLFFDITSDEKCIKICNSFSESYEQQKTTISAYKIDENNSMKSFLIHFESVMNSVGNLEKIAEERPYYYEFMNDVIDMEIFLNEDFEKEYNDILIQNCSSYSRGLSIYFPEFLSYSKDSWEYIPERLQFLQFCPSYLNLLERVEEIKSSSLVIDSYEPNNFQIDSYKLIQKDKKLSSYLWNEIDEDWYVLNNSESITYLKLTEPYLCDYNLSVLLYKDEKCIKSLIENEQNEVYLADYLFDKVYIKVYSAFGYYSQKDSYILAWD